MQPFLNPSDVGPILPDEFQQAENLMSHVEDMLKCEFNGNDIYIGLESNIAPRVVRKVQRALQAVGWTVDLQFAPVAQDKPRDANDREADWSDRAQLLPMVGLSLISPGANTMTGTTTSYNHKIRPSGVVVNSR